VLVRDFAASSWWKGKHWKREKGREEEKKKKKQKKEDKEEGEGWGRKRKRERERDPICSFLRNPLWH
jgi:hypothetical protein